MERLAAGVAFVALALVATVVGLSLAGVDGSPSLVVAVHTPLPPPGATEDATPGVEALPTEDPDLPTLKALRDFQEEYGDPPSANRGRFRIPRIGVDAALGAREVGLDGNMPIPEGPSDVVWYDFSAWPNYGGPPGEGRNAVFAAHVDYAAVVPYAQVNYRGPGVFRDLQLLARGDVIEVQMDGETSRYHVLWVRNFSAEESDWASLLSSDVEGDAITLITCGGEFNFNTREYEERTIVRALRA
jgi:LPXTG-site transpeptidase (sortase) family protein